MKADETYLKEITKMEKQEPRIIDGFEIQPLDQLNRTILMAIIKDWHSKRSTLITSQVPVNKWHDVIAEQNIADAIFDRIIHDSHRLELKGDSISKKRTILTAEITENDT